MIEKHTPPPNTQENLPTGTTTVSTRHFVLWRFADLKIRLKIIGPFLALTLFVAIIGIYIVTNLVFTNLNDRLAQHALEAGQIVSNILARQDLKHQETARAIAYTEGFITALESKHAARACDLAVPTADNDQIELLLAIAADGEVVLHLRQEEGKAIVATDPINMEFAGIIQDIVRSHPQEYIIRRAIARHPFNQQYYYLTILTLHTVADGFVGVMVTGTSLDTLMPQFKRNSLADVIVYLDAGQAVATTFYAEDPQLLNTLRLDAATYQERLTDAQLTALDTIEVNQREYRLATSSLHIGNDILGVFSVALSTDYVFTAGQANRNSYLAIFGFATLAIILVGSLIAQGIIVPVHQLARTSRAVTQGDLEQRVALTSKDEIGQLGRDFDSMTESLAKRNAELRAALSQKRAILSSIGDGVLLEDTTGNITPANTAAETMLAEMSQGFELSSLRDITETPSEPKESQDNPWLIESRRIQVGEKIITAHSAAVRTEVGEELGTVIVLRDVTAEAEAQQIKDAFVEHVSHELRTPLTSIKGYSDLLLATTRDTLGAQQQLFLKTIIRQTENLTTMVNALLDFSEMQASGHLGLRSQSIDLPKLIEGLATEWRPKIEDKALDFIVEIAKDVPQTIQGDGKRLRWALMNLIRNAYQYTDRGSITMQAHMLNTQQLSITVSDTGIGISPKNQHRIFNRFYRVMNVDDDKVRGLGFGLYVGKAIIEAHQGTLNVSSALNKGSTFTIKLPTLTQDAH